MEGGDESDCERQNREYPTIKASKSPGTSPRTAGMRVNGVENDNGESTYRIEVAKMTVYR